MAIEVVAEYCEGVTILSDDKGRFLITKHSSDMIHIPERVRTVDKLPFSLHMNNMRHQEVRAMMT